MSGGVFSPGAQGRSGADERPEAGHPRAEQPQEGGRHPGVHSRKIPAFEGRCIPAGFFALPHRTASGTPRLGASPVGAHRSSRCTASSATDPGTPGGAFRGGRSSADVRGFSHVERRSEDPLRGSGAGQGPKTRGIRRPVQGAVASAAKRKPPRSPDTGRGNALGRRPDTTPYLRDAAVSGTRVPGSPLSWVDARLVRTRHFVNFNFCLIS
jgi:hypothetical protein